MKIYLRLGLLLLLLLLLLRSVATIATGKIIIAGGCIPGGCVAAIAIRSAIAVRSTIAIHSAIIVVITLFHVLVVIIIDVHGKSDNCSLLDATSRQVLVVLEYLALVYQAELHDRQG